MFSTIRKPVQLFSMVLATRSVLSQKYHQSITVSNSYFVNYTCKRFFSDKKEEDKREYFDTALTLKTFTDEEKKDKDTYLECIRKYESTGGRKTDTTAFLYAALKYMDEFGVNKDLECYKKLLDTYPKGKMIPTNKLQAEFMHYPKEQKCATYILEKMESNKVCPDSEMERILLNVFGKDSIPIHKFWRIMYWMPKFKNLSPWPLPKPLPNDPMELAKLAIWRISSIDFQAQITVFQTETVEDSIDKTWIVSAMAPTQKKLLEDQRSHKGAILYVEGPFTTWVGDRAVDYFVLLLKTPKEKRIKIDHVDMDDVSNLNISYWTTKKTSIITYPSVHEQIHETIFSVCATGTSSKDSILSWIRCLQKDNPVLSELNVVFTLRQKPNEAQQIEDSSTAKASNKQQKEIDQR